MSEQPLDLSRSMQIVRRRMVNVCAVAGIGLAAGAVYAALTPPQAVTSALVLLPPNARDAATQAVIAASDKVLASAERAARTAVPLLDLRSRIDVTVLASGVLSVQATASSAAQAERLANAVAHSYIAYVSTDLAGPDRRAAAMLAPASEASTGSELVRLFIGGGLGALAGALVAVVGVLAAGRRDRRLRLRDEIASAIGVPVLVSLRAWHATGADAWAKLLHHYEPSTTEAWQLRRALRRLDPGGAVGTSDGSGSGYSVTVLSLASDRRALAVGPQLAAFAACQGIKTAMVFGPQPEGAATATLRVACTAYRQTEQTRGQLDVCVADPGLPDSNPDASLTVIVTAVDGAAHHITATNRTNATLLAVSPGAATAEELARVAAAAASDGRQIDGVLIADPEPADWTSGRIPLLIGPRNPAQPTRTTDVPAGSLLSTITSR